MTNRFHVEPLQPEHVYYVATLMRQKDREEIYAVRYTDEPMDLASESALWGENAWTAFLDGIPVAVFGAVPQHPGVHSIWMFATDQFMSIAVSFTKYLRRVMVKRWEREAHRIECKSLFSHTEAHAWLELFGLKKESVLKNYGKHGEDFYLFAWTKE